MPTPLPDPAKVEPAHLGTRLDCWKEIAAYLGKGERTVKRWETERGMPAHRIPGGGRSSVYAYTVELDQWLKSRSAQELDAPKAESQEAIAGTPVQVPSSAEETSAPVPALNDAVQASPALLPDPPRTKQPTPKGNFLLPLSALILVALGGAVLYPAILRTAGLRLSSRFPSFLAKSRQTPDSHAAIPVSEEEKNLAHDFYLKGRYDWNQRTPDSLNRALDDFTQAVVHDPGYALAYVGLADTYDLLREYSTMPDNAAFSRALAAARKAVELDDSLPEAHRALAFAEYYGNWDFVDGEKEFRRAIQLNPRDSDAHKWFANAIAVQGRFQESLEEIDKAQELDPSSHTILADKGIMLFQAGKREEAIELLKQVERAAPEFPAPHLYLGIIGWEIHDDPLFLAETGKTAELTNDPTLKDIIAAARAGYARGGQQGMLEETYARQREYYLAGKLWGTPLARTCTRMGKKQEALLLLEEGYNRHDPHVLECLTHFDLLSLRREPRFKALVKKFNFPVSSSGELQDPVSAEDHSPFRAASDPH
jgi:tetratricopeptide (TPR) repeat protein